MMVFCVLSVGKTVFEGVILFGSGVERIDQLELYAAGKLAALARPGDHFVRNLLCRSGDQVMCL